jgi:hypothetical protein
VKKVTVKLQEGIVIATTDPEAPVLPAEVWKEISRVGFKPVGMEVQARGAFEGGAFVIDARRWPLSGKAPVETGTRTVRLKTTGGAEDPPKVEVVE